MADGFGAIGFGVLVSRPGESYKAEYTTTHIPGSTTINYIDVAGVLPKEFRITVKLDSMLDYGSLAAAVGAVGTLTINNSAHVGSLLTSLDWRATTPGGYQLADAVFIVP